MKWKIFFWALCLFTLYDLAAITSLPSGEWFPIIFHHIIFFGELVGLFAYIYGKKIGNRQFWKYFLGINIILDILSILYTLYPNAVYLQFYKYIYGNTVTDIGNLMLAVVADMPLLYAMYRLSQGEFYMPESKKIMFVSSGIPKWGLVQTALWGYSLVISTVFFLSSIFPRASSEVSSAPTEVLYGLLMIVPMVIFWLYIILQLKYYQKNWWRLTLLANGLFISLMMVGGMIIPSDDLGGESSMASEFMGILQFLIMVISLYVYGREQFPKNIDKKKIPA